MRIKASNKNFFTVHFYLLDPEPIIHDLVNLNLDHTVEDDDYDDDDDDERDTGSSHTAVQ